MRNYKTYNPLEYLGKIPELIRCVRHSKEWPTLIGGYTGLRRLGFPREFITPYGDAMTLETFLDLVTVWVVFYRDEYPVDPSLRRVVDAGANIGSFTLLAARAAPEARIVALEPFPATRMRLASHVERNGLGARVDCLPLALAHSDGRRFMAEADMPSQSRGLSEEGRDGGGIAVETVTLSTLLHRQGWDGADLLKIDIEGAEHEVLLSAPDDVLRRFSSIALEYHPNRPKAPLFGRLRDVGFRISKDMGTPPGSDGGVALLRRP